MELIDLKVEKRKELGKKVKHLRRNGLLPGVVYGRDFSTIPISLDYKSYIKAISGDAGTNVIINLNITDGEEERLPVITHGIQRNPLNDEIIHVDFHKINMKEKIQTKIPIEVIGEAAGVKEEGGIMIHALTELEIECLPMEIPANVEVDVSPLKIGDGIQVSELKSLIKGDVTIITPETETVVSVIPPAKEEVAPPPEAVPEEAAVPGEAPPEGEAAEAKPEAAPKAEKKPAEKAEK